MLLFKVVQGSISLDNYKVTSITPN